MINPLAAAYLKRKKDAEFQMPDDPDAFVANLKARIDAQDAGGVEGDGPQPSAADSISSPVSPNPPPAAGGPPKITVSRGPVEESPTDVVRAYLLKRMNQKPEAHADSEQLRNARAADSLFGAGAEISNLYLQLRKLPGTRKGTNLAGDVMASEVANRTEKLKDQSGRDAIAQRMYGEQMDAEQKAAERESIDAKAAADRAERMGREMRMGDQFKASLEQRQSESASKAERDAADLALREKALNKPKQFAPRAAPKAAKEGEEGKMMPATTVEGLAELPVAESQVDRLVSEFKRLKMGGASGRAGSAATDALGLGFTDSAEYNAAAKLAMQAAGKILEGGKLAAGDEVKYKAMLPRAGDSDAVVADKAQAMKGFLRDLAHSRAAGLKASGYRVPDQFMGAAPTVAPSGSVVHMRNDAGLEIDVAPEKVEARKKMGFKEIGP